MKLLLVPDWVLECRGKDRIDCKDRWEAYQEILRLRETPVAPAPETAPHPEPPKQEETLLVQWYAQWLHLLNGTKQEPAKP